MPKQKTHKGVAKRIKITGRGKVRRYPCGARKLLSKKSGKKKRHLSRPGIIQGGSAQRLKELVSGS